MRDQRTGAGSRPPFVPGRRQPFTPPVRGYLGARLPPISEGLTRSSTLTRAALPRREVLILALILNHPALLEAHFEDILHLEFANADVARLRDAIIHLSGEDLHDHGTLRQALVSHGLEDFCNRVETAAEKLPHWHLRQDASELDADQVLRQALTLHHKMQALNKDLRAAEQALARDPSELQFALLRDVQFQLAALNGIEATVEGFGLTSGRLEQNL